MRNRDDDALYTAAQKGDIASAERYIAAGYPLTSIMIAGAAANNRTDFINALGKHLSNINMYFHEQFTPLLHAAYWGSKNAVIALLNNGADIRLMHKTMNHSALYSAMYGEHPDILDALVTHAITKLSLDEFIKFMQDNNNLRYCLESAQTKDECLTLKRLIDHMLANNIDYKTIIAMLPEKYSYKYYYFKEAIFEEANKLATKDQVTAFTNMLNPEHPYGCIMWQQRGSKPCREGHGILKKITAAKFNANTLVKRDNIKRDELNRKLYNAADEGYLELAKSCINDGAVVNEPVRADLQYPLIIAAIHGHTNIVELLLQHHAIVDISVTGTTSPPIAGVTALFVAAQQDRVDVVKILLDNHANPNNKRLADDGTALMMACQKGNYRVVEALLEFGADIFALLKSSSSALTIAISNHHPEVFELLIEHIINQYEVAMVVKFLETDEILKALLNDPKLKGREIFFQTYMKLMTHLQDQQVSSDTLNTLLPKGCVLPSTKTEEPAATQPVVVEAAPVATKAGIYPSLHTIANAEQSDALANYLREHSSPSQPAQTVTDLLFSTSYINAALAPPLIPTIAAAMPDATIKAATVSEQAVTGELISFAPSELIVADTEESRINATLMTLGTLFAPAVTQADEVTSDREEDALAKLEALKAPEHKYPTTNKPKTKTMVTN